MKIFDEKLEKMSDIKSHGERNFAVYIDSVEMSKNWKDDPTAKPSSLYYY